MVDIIEACSSTAARAARRQSDHPGDPALPPRRRESDGQAPAPNAARRKLYARRRPPVLWRPSVRSGAGARASTPYPRALAEMRSPPRRTKRSRKGRASLLFAGYLPTSAFHHGIRAHGRDATRPSERRETRHGRDDRATANVPWTKPIAAAPTPACRFSPAETVLAMRLRAAIPVVQDDVALRRGVALARKARRGSAGGAAIPANWRGRRFARCPWACRSTCSPLPNE